MVGSKRKHEENEEDMEIHAVPVLEVQMDAFNQEEEYELNIEDWAVDDVTGKKLCRTAVQKACRRNRVHEETSCVCGGAD